MLDSVEDTLIIVLAVFGFIIGAVVIVGIIVIVALTIKKKTNAFIEQNSLSLKLLDELNNKMRCRFGHIGNCDIYHYVGYKTKRSYDNFIASEKKVLQTVLNQQDEVIKHVEWVIKNAFTKEIYDEEVRKLINKTDLDALKFPSYITKDKFLEIEKEKFNNKILNTPTTFSLYIIVRYSSAKGYSNYEYKIPASYKDLVMTFKMLKRIDIVKIARENLNLPLAEEAKNSLDKIEDYKGKPNLSYKEELLLTYKELVSYLLSKYGKVPGDYFSTKSCKSKNKKISRTAEGLYVHHIDEDKAIMLSTDKFAVENPFEYQKADRLVYCDILEHLMLHIKIVEEPRRADANPLEIPGIGGAINFICKQINDCYSDYEFSQPLMIKIRDMIKDSFEDYITILKRFLSVAEKKPEYSQIITKRELSRGFYGNVVDRVYKRL